MDQLWTSLVSIATAITGVAIVAVLVSRNSQTPEVISSAGNAFSRALGVAVSPVSGGALGSFTSNIDIGGNRLF